MSAPSELSWLEAWQQPPTFLESDPRTACFAGVDAGDSLQSMMFGIVGCGVGMVVMGVIAVGYMQGLLAGSKALRSDRPRSGIFRSEPPPPMAARRVEVVQVDGTVRRKRS